MKKTGIYKIENILNNKKYIGQSVDIMQRFRQQRYVLRHNISKNERLQFEYNQYGEENFTFQIIELCEESNLDERECYYISLYNTLDFNFRYNIETGGKIGKENEHKKFGRTITKAENKKSFKYEKSKVKVVLLNTREVFESAEIAAKEKGTDRSSLLKCCKGILLSSGKDSEGNKMVWRVYEDYISMTNKGIEEAINISQNYKCKALYQKIKCIETGEVFDSIKEACEKYNTSPSNITGYLKGRQYSAGRDKNGRLLHWDYV